VAKQLENSNKDNVELIQENEKLKKEIEKLKEDIKTNYIKLGNGGGKGKGRTSIKHKAMFDEIERLKKENEKLKEEIQENEDFTDSLTEEVGTPILPNIEKLKEKIEELEYRIQLKDKDLNQLTPLYEYADKLWRETEYPQLPKICLREPQEIVSMLKCLSETIESLKEGQKSCEEDIQEAEEENKRLNLEVEFLYEEIEKLKNEDNEKLKRERDKMKSTLEDIRSNHNGLGVVCKRYEDTIEKLKERLKDADYYLSTYDFVWNDKEEGYIEINTGETDEETTEE